MSSNPDSRFPELVQSSEQACILKQSKANIVRKSVLIENLWTVSAVSEFLRLPPKTIYSWVHQRKIPFLKLGNRLRFRGKEIEKWLSNKGGY